MGQPEESVVNRSADHPPPPTTIDSSQLTSGLDALRRAEALVAELHEGCCQPLRSPRMEKLASTVREAQAALAGLSHDPDRAPDVVAMLEDAGSQLGYLQVACCTPARLELYTEALNCLARTQRLITRSLDLDH
jgi:hypothetical protein